MGTVTLLQAEGLISSPNELTLPSGGLVEAFNVQVRRKGIYEPRRGFSLGNGPASFGDMKVQTAAAKNFFGITHVIDAGGNGYIGNVELPGFLPRDNSLQRINMVQTGDRLWVSDRQFTKAVSFTGAFGSLAQAPAGLPQPNDMRLNTRSSWTEPGWMATNTSVAYRATFVYYLDGRLIESAPSNRIVATNTGSPANPNLRLSFQSFAGTVEPQFVRLYRSEAVPIGVTPSDELFLAVEQAYSHPTGVTDILDTQPEALLGPPLYTNPVTGDGILSANFPPPNGVDVELFDGRLWVANTRGPSRATVTLIGVGAPNGLQAGDTITVNGVTYTANGGGTTGFALSTGGTPTQNIETTARNLVDTINNHNRSLTPPATLARYLSSVDDAPGIIGFEWQTPTGAVGANVTVSRSSAWQITQQTTVDHRPHGVSFSKQDQPDAFPATNFILVNTSAASILRIKALRDRLFVFKTDGLYIISGTAPYRVDMLDDTAILVSPDAIAQCNGVLYALTLQGAVAITDSGVRIVSLPVEQLIRKTLADAGVGEDFTGAKYQQNLKDLGRKTFAVAYETERLVTFWLAGSLGLAFNTLYNVWTINLAPLVDAASSRRRTVVPLLTLGALERLEWAGVEPTSGAMWLWQEQQEWKERKRLDRWDNADEVPDAGDLSGEPTIATVLPWSDTTNVRVGDALQVLSKNDADLPAVPASLAIAVRIVGKTPTSLVIDAPLAFDIFSVSEAPGTDVRTVISRAIPVLLRYAPITAGQPHLTKSFREATFHFMDYSVERANVICTTELVTNLPPDATQPVQGPPNLWTETRDSDEVPVPRDNKRRLIPHDKARGTQLVIGWEVFEPFCHWLLCGVSVETDGVSERNSR